MELSESIIKYIEENRVSTTEVADCLGKSIGVAPDGMMPITPGHFAVGEVKYLFAIGASNWYIHKDMSDGVETGKIIFMDAIDTDERAIAGDLVSKYFLLYLKNKAIITNGKMRDAHRLIKENYSIWCRGVSPRGCYNNEPTKECLSGFKTLIDKRKKIFEKAIAVCDDSGVVIIPKEKLTKSFYSKLIEIEEQEDTWYECIDRKRWNTFQTVCLKEYLRK